MEKNLSRVEIQLTTSMVDLCPDNDVFMEPSEEGDLKEKAKKKKKKSKGGLQSPKRLLAFNTSELLKLDEQKAEMKKSACEKDRSNCAPFRSCYENQHSESSGDSEDFDQQPTYASSADKYPTVCKSALRGGYEELGLGPRPKFRVKWAPNVWDPPISSISHTINHNRSKKNDSKHNRHNSKSCSDPGKQGKKKSHIKLKHNKVSSAHSPSTSGSGKGISKKHEAESSSQPYPHTGGLEVVLREAVDDKLEYEPQCEVLLDGKTTLAGGCTTNGLWFSHDSKCAVSFLGISNTMCNFVCEHAM